MDGISRQNPLLQDKCMLNKTNIVLTTIGSNKKILFPKKCKKLHFSNLSDGMFPLIKNNKIYSEMHKTINISKENKNMITSPGSLDKNTLFSKYNENQEISLKESIKQLMNENDELKNTFKTLKKDVENFVTQ